MPSYIVKVERDRDEYVWWSDIVEAPIARITDDPAAFDLLEPFEDGGDFAAVPPAAAGQVGA